MRLTVDSVVELSTLYHGQSGKSCTVQWFRKWPALMAFSRGRNY